MNQIDDLEKISNQIDDEINKIEDIIKNINKELKIDCIKSIKSENEEEKDNLK